MNGDKQIKSTDWLTKGYNEEGLTRMKTEAIKEANAELRDKQIEEMMKVINDICPFYKEYGTCEQCNTAFDIEDEPCYWECMAKAIINNGYRKASEVAEEIFAEIDEHLNLLDRRHMLCGNPKQSWGVRSAMTEIAELKKKYTEDGGCQEY